MSKRPRHRITIDSLDENGAGVGVAAGLGGRRLHVAFALPGEEVLAEVEHQSPHRPDAWGPMVQLLRPSPLRVDPACAAWGRCGGCAVQHLDYQGQLDWKRELVVTALQTAGVEVPVAPCLAPNRTSPGAAPRPYRNRSKLVFARAFTAGDDDGPRVMLGAYAPRSHHMVDLTGCALVIPPLDAVARTIARLATELEVRPYDERGGDGDARYAILRANPDGATQVMLVVARRDAPGLVELARGVVAAHPEVGAVVENLQPSRGNVLVGDVEPDRVIAGDPDAVDIKGRVGGPDGITLRLSPRAFFQASWPGADLLYALAVDGAALVAGEAAVDLYTGAGGIALLAARRHPDARVTGVEESPHAVQDAQAAARANGLANVSFHCADSARFMAESVAAPPAVVFVDPPRRGLPPSLIDAITRAGPRRVVYVSCAPDTLARDLALFVARGYHPREVTPVDLMPDNSQIETATIVDRDPRQT